MKYCFRSFRSKGLLSVGMLTAFCIATPAKIYALNVKSDHSSHLIYHFDTTDPGQPESPSPQEDPEKPTDSLPAPGTPSTGTPTPSPQRVVRPPARPSSGPRPYNQIVTKSAVTKEGLFKTHQVGSRIYFEIPQSELGKDLFVVGRYVKVSADNPNTGPFGGDQFGSRTIRLERREHSILMRAVSHGVINDDTTQSISRAVDAASLAPILASIGISAYGEDSSVVIDVTPMFTTSSDFSALGTGTRLDGNRSFIERVSAFPENINVEATQTGTVQGGGVRTAVGLWSIIKLPEKPMMPRLADRRVGFFSVGRVDFGTDEHKAVTKRFITRWRLEKKDPNARLSEPVKPIVYYVDPATPDKWKPFVKAGIEAWQVAFEAAGFKNAIIAKDVPVDDPDWSMEDIRHTVVRWLPSTSENAQGPHVRDPRTGEILNGSIRMFHNILNLQRAWYFTQVAPLDKRAQTFPFPDSLMGRLLQYVVEHELGHTLGFTHNHKASSTYPVDSLRSVSWLRKMGPVASLMDYARFNYVAQPEDNIPPELLIPRVGPYDKFATMWGYAPIPGAKTPEDELHALNEWAKMQDTIPWYRYGAGAETGYAGNPDYGDAREAIGDADAVKASTLGIKNIKRLMPMLAPAAVHPGKSYSDLAEMYGRLISQWQLEMGHVVNIIGSTETQTKYAGQEGPVYEPVSRARQVEAMRFLSENVFTTPDYLIDPQISSLIHPEGGSSRVLSAQIRIMRGLFEPNRIKRMAAFESANANPSEVYTVSEMLYDLRHSMWSELKSPAQVHIDAHRRGLQRNHLDTYNLILHPPKPEPTRQGQRPQRPPPPPHGELVAGIRAELIDLEIDINAALQRTADRQTRAHLIDATHRIREILK